MNKEKILVILGSAKTCKEIQSYISDSSDITKYFIQRDFDILTGCGTKGIMGQVYKTAAEYSIKENGKPIQNKVIIREPLWGDEDLDNCIVTDKANTEAERLDKFIKISNNFLIFPGGITTMQEATTLIQENRHRGYDKKIVLYGKDFWQGLIEQYKYIFSQGIIKDNPIGKEFFIANTKKDVIKLFSIKIR